jgi:CheY-like chemotaxis protein
VSGEKQALSRAMFLILNEALKTAPARTKTDVRTYLDAIKGEVCLEVKLTGEGFQKENQQATAVLYENSTDLMNAQKIVEIHHGRIDIDQGDEADIRICVSLPAILEKKVKGKPRLLVVENSVLMRSILKEALEQEGFIVKVAENGASALDRMGNYLPDIIISDVVMPVMDGFEFFEAVREQAQWQDIPFIFVTGQSDQKIELNLRALRGATYLLKPIIIDELLVAVRSRLPA